MQEFLTDFQAATKGTKAKWGVYLLFGNCAGNNYFIAAFDSEGAANMARDRCIVNDDSVKYSIQYTHIYDVYDI